VRAVLGQQVSTVAARGLCAAITRAADCRAEVDGESTLLFPNPEALGAVPDKVLKMPGSRRQTLRAVCELFARHPPEEALLERLAELRGIGPWTLDLVAMRGLANPDRFPSSDLGLVKAAAAGGVSDRRALLKHSEQWQPWRSYAANLLWRSLDNG
jgi:AraC family transcriptional regulator of adaptative response / DNA-3-methyladenine glycosylase II